MFFWMAGLLLTQQVDPAELLLDAFGANCESRGIFTDRALNETKNLEHVIQTLYDDPECKDGLMPLFQSIVPARQQLEYLHKGFYNERYDALQEQIARLTLYSQLAVTADESTSIGEALAESRADYLKFELERQSEVIDSRAVATAVTMEYLESLSSALPKLSGCFKRNSNLPVILAGQVASISGGFFGQVAHSALTLSGRLFSTVFNYFSEKTFTEALQKIRGSKLQLGLSCAIESLEKSITTIQDQRTLVELEEGLFQTKEIPLEWRGYDLLFHDYPTLRRFLLTVEAGSKAQTGRQGEARAQYRQLEGNFKASLEGVAGTFADAERKLQRLDVNDSASKKRVIQSLLDDIAYAIFYKFTNNNIFRTVIPSVGQDNRLYIWLRTGNPNPDISAFENSYDRYLVSISENILQLEKVKENYLAIEKSALDELLLQRSLIMEPDPLGSLVAWTERSSQRENAGIILERFITYFEALQIDWNNHRDYFSSAAEFRDQQTLLAETLMRFREVYEILTSDEGIPAEKLKKIYQAMELQESDQFISKRLAQHVNMDLQRRLKLGLLSGPDKLRSLLQLTTKDMLSVLGSQPFLPSKAREDLMEAEVLTKWNIFNFFEFFKEDVERSLTELLAQSRQWKESRAGSYRKKFAKLCMLTLNSPRIEEKSYDKIRQLCSIEEINSQIGDEAMSLHFTKSLENHPDPDKRLGLYSRFRERVGLKESMIHRSKP